jgi:hypothetical protein
MDPATFKISVLRLQITWVCSWLNFWATFSEHLGGKEQEIWKINQQTTQNSLFLKKISIKGLEEGRYQKFDSQDGLFWTITFSISENSILALSKTMQFFD